MCNLGFSLVYFQTTSESLNPYGKKRTLRDLSSFKWRTLKYIIFIVPWNNLSIYVLRDLSMALTAVAMC